MSDNGVCRVQGKQKHATPQAAWRHLSSLQRGNRRRHKRRPGGSIYRCLYCRHWHVTSMQRGECHHQPGGTA